MEQLSIDIETFSPVNLKDCGVYKYAESLMFTILLFGYSVDGGPVIVIELASGEKIPDEIIEAIKDDKVIKWAYNANFERVCLSAYLGVYLDPKSWRCSMIWASYLGLPRSLEQVGSVLKLDEQKMTEGKALIRYFTMPCAPTKTNGGRTRNLPEHAPEKWEKFKEYNKRDVEVELAIKDKIKNFPVPDFVWEEFIQDQEINDRGILLDMDVVDNAIMIDEKVKPALMDKIKAFTGLENPNSVMQMLGWVREQGVETASLDKKSVETILNSNPPEVVDKVLRLRQQTSKSSIKKYTAMKNLACNDDRARGCFAFYAARTGRWAGRHIQLQNLYRNSMPDLKEARELVRTGNYDALTMLYDNVPEVLAELIRTAFIPPEGMKYIVSDFAQIEARVIAYLAGEQWVLDTFINGGDIYCATASRMYGVPVEKHGANAELRQYGKRASLSCQYGGSKGALIAMGALESGMKEEELQPLVDAWRESNPNIVRFWWDIDRAVKKTVKERVDTEVNGIKFSYKSGMLFIKLPSGRKLVYVRPHMGVNKFGSESVLFWGVEGKRWVKKKHTGRSSPRILRRQSAVIFWLTL